MKSSNTRAAEFEVERQRAFALPVREVQLRQRLLQNSRG